MTVSEKLLQVEISYELHNRIMAEAKKLSVSKSDFVRMILIRALADHATYPLIASPPLPIETQDAQS